MSTLLFQRSLSIRTTTRRRTLASCSVMILLGLFTVFGGCVFLVRLVPVHAFVPSARGAVRTNSSIRRHLIHEGRSSRRSGKSTSTIVCLGATVKCTPLPSGMSPFQKGISKSLDIQGTFRKIAATALDRAVADGETLLEIDIPPFVGNGDKTKSQFDDFDNVQELNANRDWCVQLIPLLKQRPVTWLILPDDKECELAANEWTGQLYRKNTRFTSIRGACLAVQDSSKQDKQQSSSFTFKKAWGSSFAESVNRLQGGDGILADSSTLDALNAGTPRLHLVCQPGNGGPVEDWINVEQLHDFSSSSLQQQQPTCIVNGALDKVRDGYYPAIFFPALAKTIPFYKQFEPILIAKPITNKGLYGWLYRVYPEPWQVILQTSRTVLGKNSQTTEIQVDESIAMISDSRPTFAEAVNALVAKSLSV